MAEEEDIRIKITAEGADEAARKVDGVAISAERFADAASDAAKEADELKKKMDEEADAAKKAAREHEQFEQKVKKAAHEAYGLVTAITQVSQALGSRQAGMLQAVTDSVMQFGAMGAALGPGGAVAGGLAGAAVGLAGVAREAGNAQRAMEALLASGVDSMRELAAATGDETGDSWASSMAAAREELDTLNDRAEELRATVNSPFGLLDELGARAAAVELRRVEDTIRGVTSAMNELSAAAEDSPLAANDGTNTGFGTGLSTFLSLDTGLMGAENRENSRRRGGRGTPATTFENEDSQARGFGATDSLDADERAAAADAIIAERNAAIEADNARIESANARAEAEMEIAEEKRQAILELEREGLEAQRELEEEHAEYVRELADEEAENRKERFEREREEGIQMQTELMQLGMQTTKMLTKAIGDVVTGAKSGEDAFRGLLSSFLEMISEYAALSAAREFADAISSFASQNYAGGAQHLAAGIAFTALAVATGVGAAVAAPPAKETAKPAERETTGAQGGSVTNVINWNSPVVTAGTRAELGREIEGLMSEAEAA